MNGYAAERMASQLAQQFAHLPVEESAARIAQHVLMFWEPRIRAELLSAVGESTSTCSPAVRRAAEIVAGR